MAPKGKKKSPVQKQTVNINFPTNSIAKFRSYILTALLIYVIILTFPRLIIDAREDIDYSWYVGLHKSVETGMVYGRDVVFTYGPLGFLTIPILINKTLWMYSALYTLPLYALTIFGCSLYIKKIKANLLKTFVFSIIFTAIFNGWLIGRTGRDFELVLLVFIFSHLYTIRKQGLIPLSGLAFLYSVLPFIKFSAALAGSITGAVFVGILILNKRYKETAIFLTISLISFCILGLMLIGPPKSIFTYLYGCWQISSGYNDAMGLDHGALTKDYLFAIFAWVSYTGLLAYHALRKRKFDLLFFALSFGPLFLYFKLGFVRHDHAHVIYFYSMWLSIFGLFFLRSFADAKILNYFVLLFILAMLYQCNATISSLNVSPYTPTGVPDNLKNLRLSFNLIRGIGVSEQKEKVKAQLIKFFPLQTATVAMLSGRTMDVLPTDISIVEAYGFEWHPRPVFQSYSAYTEYLDSINAKYFASDSAPQYALYALSAIDGRYPLSEEPATFRTLLQKYEPCAQDAKFIVLRKKSYADTAAEKFIGMGTARFSQGIALPKINDDLLFAKIRIEYSLLGTVQKLLYKPPNIYIVFLNNQKVIDERMWRFVSANAANGIFVSKYVRNQNDLLEIWKSPVQQDIDGIALFTEHPASFKDKITIQLFTIPMIK